MRTAGQQVPGQVVVLEHVGTFPSPRRNDHPLGTQSNESLSLLNAEIVLFIEPECGRVVDDFDSLVSRHFLHQGREAILRQFRIVL